MEARGLRVVRHLHLRAERHEPVERLALGGAGVDGGDDAQGPPGAAVRAELVFEHAEAVPADEGAEQVDGVGGWNLVRQRVSERRLAAGVDEEVGGGERDERRDDVRSSSRIPVTG